MVLRRQSVLRELLVPAALLASGLFFVLPAAARITCCEVDGKRFCGDPAPAQCLNKAKKVFNRGVAKEIEAPLTAEQRAARDAEETRKKEEEKKAAEQERRDHALMASYSNAKEIDAARNRAIAEIRRNAEQANNRLDAAQKKQQKLEQEKEFYKKKPLPAPLKSQIQDNEAEIAAQQKALQDKDADIAAINARFDAEKERYLNLSGRK